MEPIDLEGKFWPASTPENEVPGRVSLDTNSGGKLVLIGAFYDLRREVGGPTEEQTPFEIGGRPLGPIEGIRIHGQAGNLKLTLENCIRIETVQSFPTGTAREEYHVGMVFLGIHLEEAEPLEFACVNLRISHLEQWVGKTGIEVSFHADGSTDNVDGFQVRRGSMAHEIVSTGYGKLGLDFRYPVFFDWISEARIRQECVMGLGLTEPKALDHILRMCSALQNLITIGLDSPSSVVSLMLHQEPGPIFRDAAADGMVELLPRSALRCKDTMSRVGRPLRTVIRCCSTSITIGLDSPSSVVSLMLHQEPGPIFRDAAADGMVELRAPMQGHDVPGRETAPHRHQMLFNFEDVGGIDGVARWVDIAEKYETVMGSLVSHWYLPRLYSEHRFFNACTAAEAMRRIQLQKQTFNFGNELKLLALQAGKPFEALVGDTDAWRKKVIQARVNYVVHPGLQKVRAADGLYPLSESLYFLVVMCLLRECGVPEETVDRVCQYQRFRILTRQLKDVL